ncbi:hypothetical protein N7535_001529 [Penicillium sp. DV-2018c]|nr:hypothetical protein N7461_005226 [Penicillium sp. DV-2018c]KAJ5582909.1 hypothetical protein N7535_001529 [Penicillium sp. DV-2018c]
MPDVIIVNDNASFASSDTFSTRGSTEQPRPELRRKKSTVVQLTRKVSKRISQSILRTGPPDRELTQLSERNLRDLNNATHTESHITRAPERQLHGVDLRGAIYEEMEEECPPVDVEAVREMRIHESYAAFCHNFTLSGNTRRSRRFDLSMGLGRSSENIQSAPTPQRSETKDISESSQYHTNIDPTSVHPWPRPTAAVFPISDTSIERNIAPTPSSITPERRSSKWPESIPSEPNAEDDFTGIRSSFDINRTPNYPRPPPQVITPTAWMDQQRKEQNRKAARRQRIFDPFRSWFLAGQPSWGRRYEVVE